MRMKCGTLLLGAALSFITACGGDGRSGNVRNEIVVPDNPDSKEGAPALDAGEAIRRATLSFQRIEGVFVHEPPGFEARVVGDRLNFRPARGRLGCAGEPADERS